MTNTWNDELSPLCPVPCKAIHRHVSVGVMTLDTVWRLGGHVIPLDSSCSENVQFFAFFFFQ